MWGHIILYLSASDLRLLDATFSGKHRYLQWRKTLWHCKSLVKLCSVVFVWTRGANALGVAVPTIE